MPGSRRWRGAWRASTTTGRAPVPDPSRSPARRTSCPPAGRQGLQWLLLRELPSLAAHEGPGGRPGGPAERACCPETAAAAASGWARRRLLTGEDTAAVNVRTQEAVEVLAVCLYHEDTAGTDGRGHPQAEHPRMFCVAGHGGLALPHVRTAAWRPRSSVTGRCFRFEGAHKLRPVCRHRCNACTATLGRGHAQAEHHRTWRTSNIWRPRSATCSHGRLARSRSSVTRTPLTRQLRARGAGATCQSVGVLHGGGACRRPAGSRADWNVGHPRPPPHSPGWRTRSRLQRLHWQRQARPDRLTARSALAERLSVAGFLAPPWSSAGATGQRHKKK